jgi:hypothetical protein
MIAIQSAQTAIPIIKALDAPVMTYDYSVQWCPKSFWQTNLQKIPSGNLT